MKKKTPTFIAAIFLTVNIAFSQNYCDFNNCLFWEEQPEAIIGDTVKYASNQWSIDEWDNGLGCGFFNQCENLWLEVYYPDLPVGEKRPLVVFIHGGAFITGSRGALRASAMEFASKGYVAATIDYRLCKRANCEVLKINPLALCNLNFWSDLVMPSYVAAVDGHNALRFLVDHADKYHIDPDNIIVGGVSAGGWIALSLAFFDQEEADSLASGSHNWKNIWGELNPVPGIKGVFNLAGAMIDTAFMSNNPDIPVFLAHGTCDPVVCYDYDRPFHCNNYPQIHGSADIAKKLHDNGAPYYMYTGKAMGHNVVPLVDEWQLELERFLRKNVLCGEYIQQHTVSEQTPASDECSMLENNPIPGTFSHPEREPVGLPESPGNFDSLCILPNYTDEKIADGLEIYPNPTRGGLFIKSKEKRVIKIYGCMGVLYKTIEAGGGIVFRENISDLPKGVLFFISHDTDGRRVFSKKIILR